MKLISEEKFVVHHCISAAASRRTVGLTNAHAENNAKWFIRKSGADWSQLHSELCSQLSPVEKCKASPFRARRHCFSAQKNLRSSLRQQEHGGSPLARKKLRIATHPHIQLEEEG